MNVVVPAFTTSLPYWEPLGWFKRPFANLDDLRKMRFRTSGLGMEMMKTMGVSVVTLAGGEVIPALERGAVDGAEWAIPSHDIIMGFQNVTKYYYMPDLRQPASYQEVAINKAKWDALPPDLKAIVKYACMAEIIRMTAASVDQDSKAIEEMVKKHGVQIKKTPDDVLKAQVVAIDKVYEVEAQKNPFFAKVLKSQRDFAQQVLLRFRGGDAALARGDADQFSPAPRGSRARRDGVYRDAERAELVRHRLGQAQRAEVDRP